MSYYWLQISVLSFVCVFAVENAMWNVFVTSPLYNNFKLIVPNNTLRPRLLPKGGSNAELECARNCANTRNCLAMNVMSWDGYNFCELLPDNLCSNNSAVILQPQPYARIWDKDPNNYRTCLGQRFATTVPANYCEMIHPGCRGTWPDCNDCIETCGDCLTRYGYRTGEKFNCTLWPGATSWQRAPVFTYCYGSCPILMKRKVNLTTGLVEDDYMMSLTDMNRFIQLNYYNQLYFYFNTSRNYYTAYYQNPYISANGTLSNLTFAFSNTGDGLRLNGTRLGPTPFVWIYDDRYNCGSFWLFDQHNATYCPGGQVGLFGTPRLNDTNHVIDTGIHWPIVNGTLIFIAEVYLKFYTTSGTG